MISRLVLVGPTTDPLARTLPAQLWRWIRNTPGEDNSQLPLIARDNREAGLARIRATFRAALADRIDPQRFPRDFAVLTGFHRDLAAVRHRVPLPDPLSLDALATFLADRHQGTDVTWYG